VPVGSGSRSVDDQPVAGSLQLCDDDAVSALSPRASSQYPESAGLAAGTATADVHASRREQSSATVADILRCGAPQLLGNGSSTRLPLYAELRDESDCMIWDGPVGEDFDTWDLKTLIESAKERGLQPSSPLQLHPAGFATDEANLVGSF